MIQSLEAGRADVARDILEALPDWFSNRDARETYINNVEKMPMLLANNEDQPVGFLSLKAHSKRHQEIFLIGLRPEFRRQGIGTSLVEYAISTAQRRGSNFLSVKTLAARSPDPHYAETRAFYTAVGFQFHEELPTLWGPNAPCAVYLMDLNARRRRVSQAPS
ncbi:MAG: GNAT family N-acetyltransferase [Pseudomonadota bacterium]